MVTLSQAIQYLFPTARPLVDWAVKDNGSGPFIGYWAPALGAQPTAGQIAAVTDQNIADRASQDNGAIVGRPTPVRLTATRSSSVVALADVTGLSLPLKANSHYIYEFNGAFTAAATTTGLRLSVNGPASPALIRILGWVGESATTTRQYAAGAYDSQLVGTASLAATPLPFCIYGNISTGSTPGLLTLRFGSEVAASNVDVLAGSWGKLEAVP